MESRLLSEDAALRAIVEGVESEIGQQFLASLVRHLAAALRVEYAFVSELTSARDAFRIVACWARGEQIDGFEVPLKGTPCESVLEGRMAHYPDRLQQRFPEDLGLQEWKAESYCGVPLLDQEDRVVGHLCIMHDKPMRDGPRGLAIMRIFAARARAELERQRVMKALRASEERLARVIDSAMDAIVTIDASGRVELFNDAAVKVFGCPSEEAIGRSLDRFLTPGLAKTLEASMHAASRGTASRPYVWAPAGLRARRADGNEFPVEATISHVEVGGRALFTLILRDVDERDRAQRALFERDRENEYLREEIRSVHKFDEIVGHHRGLREALEKVQLVASTDSTVLILGETGTGKELIARAVHSGSRRKDRPLIKVNCAALPEGLIESELFGHERGAFTGATEKRIGRFELADGGTIFLDEIGDMPPGVQVSLLRVLQERQFERVGGSKTLTSDVRVIAATNRDLAKAVADGSFRQDLYYRLHVFPIALPPLRERAADVPLLTHYFVDRYAAKIGRRITRVPDEVVGRLQAYAWPGNVRELENVIERAVILSPGPDLWIAPELLPTAPMCASAPRSATRNAPPSAPSSTPRAGGSLEEIERDHIVEALRRANWRLEGPAGAAVALGMNPSTLRSRIKKLGIERSRETS